MKILLFIWQVIVVAMALLWGAGVACIAIGLVDGDHSLFLYGILMIIPFTPLLVHSSSDDTNTNSYGI